MNTLSGLAPNHSGLFCSSSTRIPFSNARSEVRLRRVCGFRAVLSSPTINKSTMEVIDIGRGRGNFGGKFVAFARSNNYEFRREDDAVPEPFWLSLIKYLRSLFFFLCKQPSELKYIEWPTFQSTLKTAALTLALVAFLIVALSSVDAALCYILALVLRRT